MSAKGPGARAGQSDTSPYKRGTWQPYRAPFKDWVVISESGKIDPHTVEVILDLLRRKNPPRWVITPWPEGKTIASNLVVACQSCNKAKGSASIPLTLRPR